MNTLQILLQAPSNVKDVFAVLGVFGLLQALFGLIVLYQIIRYASGKDKIIKNQEETIRLLKKIAGEPEETGIYTEEQIN